MGSGSTNVGAGSSCHLTGCEYLRSTRVPLHPVWPMAASCTLMGTNLVRLGISQLRQAAKARHDLVIQPNFPKS
jgi:hypothetical protein